MSVPLLLFVSVLVGSSSSACVAPHAQSAARADAPRPPDVRALIDRFQADRGAVGRIWRVGPSEARRERVRKLVRDWRAELDRVDFEALDRDGEVDWILLRREVDRELEEVEQEAARMAEMQALVPFAESIAALAEARRKHEDVDAKDAAGRVDALAKELDALTRTVQAKPDAWPKSVGNRASDRVRELRRDLDEWFRFGRGYDPVFDWWVAKPWQACDEKLEAYAKLLREKVAGLEGGDDRTIVGDPIGRAALVEELAHAMIPYAPEELVRIAERELAWCRAEMRRAANDLGCGDDWKKALELVKQKHVEPGAQPALIRDLAREAIEFLETRELLTIPDLAKETWRMEMMSPERQLVSPFFTGGEVISVSFPTDGMTHEQKLMSMRGNNVHFSRATVHHELVPGHHLQQFMTSRFNAHRRAFSTPFWTEGWALYWEMRLWDEGFPKSAEDRVGMLFWRSHRCARIRFSLGFHLGELTPEQCIDMLVDEVGHEKDNAEAEVRRSFNGSYEPLYQCAYMLGALQFRALRRELVESKRMSDRAFHDAVLHAGNVPVEMVRALLVPEVPLTRDFESSWRFEPLD